MGAAEKQEIKSIRRWFRVEFHGDGSVRSVDEVEHVSKNTKLICYVEALDKTDALNLAAAKWKAFIAARMRDNTIRRNSHKRLGLCVDCSKKAAGGTIRCAAHQVINGLYDKIARAKKNGDIDALRKHTAQMETEKAKAKKRSSGKRKSKYAGAIALERYRTLVEVRAQYQDLSEEQFEVWLETQIAGKGKK
jgi:hypothetical protein